MELMNASHEVTHFLNGLGHPLREEIENLRKLILTATPDLVEGIKWNGPNYSYHGEDRITMRIQPFNKIQLIFHRGAKVKEQPEERLLGNQFPILQWKENDRAIATFHKNEEIKQHEAMIKEIVAAWLLAVD